MSENTDLTLIKQEAESYRTRDREARAQREERIKLKSARLAQARAEHLAILSAPFISRDLLSDAERAEIRASVINRQRWKQQH